MIISKANIYMCWYGPTMEYYSALKMDQQLRTLIPSCFCKGHRFSFQHPCQGAYNDTLQLLGVCVCATDAPCLHTHAHTHSHKHVHMYVLNTLR